MKRDSPLRRKRLIPNGLVMPLATTAAVTTGTPNETTITTAKPDKRIKAILPPGKEDNASSPFDAVLAAATLSSSSSTNNQGGSTTHHHHPHHQTHHQHQQSAQMPPVRIAPSNVAALATIAALTPSSAAPARSPLPGSLSKNASISSKRKSEDRNSTSTSATPTATAASPAGSTSSSVAKIDKGLRHFSQRVAAKVEEKGATTYNEVADELVQEIGREVGKCDHKNIRRRVYDALNVLMAIDVIRKDKKEIRWLGLPNEAATEMRQLEEACGEAERRIREKRKTLAELVHRLTALKALIHRNSTNAAISAAVAGVPTTTVTTTAMTTTAATAVASTSTSASSSSSSSSSSTTSSSAPTSDRLQLPFILINAPRDCRVHCEMLEDRSQYFFEFDSPFLINEDIELLRLMGLDQTQGGTLEAGGLVTWLPPDTIAFLREGGGNNNGSGGGGPSLGLGDRVGNGGGHNLLPLDIGHDASVTTAVMTAATAEGPWPDASGLLSCNIDQFLESMPPAMGLGGLAGYGPLSDINSLMVDPLPPPTAVALAHSSPVRGSRSLTGGKSGSGATSHGRPLRPFRVSAAAGGAPRNGSGGTGAGSISRQLK